MIGRKLENYYQVKLGIYRQCRKEPTQKNYKVSKVWIHEKYKDNDPYYDIALLRLAGDTTPYMPICLPPKSEYYHESAIPLPKVEFTVFSIK